MSINDQFNNTIPVGPLKLAVLDSAKELGDKVDYYIKRFRVERDHEHKSNIHFAGYEEDTYMAKCSCPRFGSGEAKGQFHESVRGADLFVLVDVWNYSLTYKLSGKVNHMSPDDHYQDLKRIISAATGKAKEVNPIMYVLTVLFVLKYIFL